MSSPLPRYLTAAEAAEVLRVKPWEVSKLCKDKLLPATKPGLKWLIDPADLRAYINAAANKGAA